ncbi:beta-defensin 109-like [Panthera pardus]|uniref:Beta-defensin 109-like n=1 Tax=Panthera pardus TaxID=9691 RepID=A0A9W2VD63_PANPR|nr:putative beta-defensin 109B [Panthera uncia]XP_053756647.1 beta-defensin 109-like [Panthera pardus]
MPTTSGRHVRPQELESWETPLQALGSFHFGVPLRGSTCCLPSSLVRSGMASAENHCLNLSGICRRDICKITEDQIGACKRRWKCCRSWWILVPIPTPLIYSDYQAPLKHKLK